jgi:hypothetical protein
MKNFDPYSIMLGKPTGHSAYFWAGTRAVTVYFESKEDKEALLDYIVNQSKGIVNQ